LDDESKKVLPFVHIQLEKTLVGTLSNVEGKFEIMAGFDDRLLFTYVGYEKHFITLEAGKGLYEVRLKRSTTELGPVVIHAGENPAHLIIRKAVENRKKNDPWV